MRATYLFVLAACLALPRFAAAQDEASGNVIVPKDFRLELLYTVPQDEEGSWVSMCVDPKGRLIVGDQYGKLYRVTPPAIGQQGEIKLEPIDLEVGGAHGLLYAFDSLYIMVNDTDQQHGLYRARDTDGDDKYDEIKLLRALEAGGEHGAHSMVVTPDGKSLAIVVGNQSKITEFAKSRVPNNWGEDNLITRIPTGFMDGSMAPQGWIATCDPNGENWELLAVGFRNQFDLAYNHQGELFTYDADMEWDIGVPWYRPTRINHVTSGAEYGFRNGSGKWPEHYIDSLGTIVDIGPGSPTGITFGYGAKFPAKYQEALFINDWSFGKLRAVHLKPQGSSYVAESEEFISGQPLALTDVIINPHDGAMYFAVGGRRTQSALYRVTYTGGESTAPAPENNEFAAERALRQKLEAFHGHADPTAVETVWPYLASEDRAIRYAARLALEWQDPGQWIVKAFNEKNPRIAIPALVAAARVSGRDEIHRAPGAGDKNEFVRKDFIGAHLELSMQRLSTADRLDWYRALALTFTRLGYPPEGTRQVLAGRLSAQFPAESRELNSELAQLLVYLQAPEAAEKIVKAMLEAPTQEEQIDYALSLRALKVGWTPALREEYFSWFVTKAVAYRGGNTFKGSLKTIREQALANLTDAEKAALKPILDQTPKETSPQELLAARKFVRKYSLDELVPLVQSGFQGGRNYDRGRAIYGAVACAACHRFEHDGGSVGPDLTSVAGRFSAKDVLESIVDPNKTISDQYAAITIETKAGKTVTGRVANLSGDSLNIVENMLDPGNMTNVDRGDVEAMEMSKVSMMPEGLLNTLQEDEIQDLIAYLLARGNRDHAMFQKTDGK
ncbi:MAG: c-type cytochrome [Planctomycetia bacterium]|nr:c-type cytochrome [Planctomycetia bacterium]